MQVYRMFGFSAAQRQKDEMRLCIQRLFNIDCKEAESCRVSSFNLIGFNSDVLSILQVGIVSL